ncbi:MAG: L-aspartate oxidase [candidate division KSB1 bacterium]|nr:L-aspartate oxidase [candidate division KSB1 bacterium]
MTTPLHRESLRTDFLIIGAGVAGLYAALHATRFGRVLLLAKAPLPESNSFHAQGGVAAAIDADDPPEQHFEDTLRTGAGLCHPEAVRVLVNEGPECVRELIDLGMPFDRQGVDVALGLEGGHRHRRILHAGGDATGRWLVQFLADRVRRHDRIRLLEHTRALGLLSDGERCSGALAYHPDSASLLRILAPATILATGGACALWARSTNPRGATGDGMMLAYNAGAELADLEFIQFHPTALALPGAPPFLISEAVRGEGAHLLNANGERFMLDVHSQAELAPRDVVARAIVREQQCSGANGVSLSLRHLDATTIRRRFRSIDRRLREYGLDLARDCIPVAPAAHYFIGGVKTGLHGETRVRGLFACGEVACTGVHGANRLASNSLLECLVFGRRAALAAADAIDGAAPITDWPAEADASPPSDAAVTFPDLRARLAQIMDKHVGILRHADGLREAEAELESLLAASGAEHPLRPNIQLCRLIVQAARRREESRGVHFREDFPASVAEFQRHSIINPPNLRESMDYAEATDRTGLAAD